MIEYQEDGPWLIADGHAIRITEEDVEKLVEYFDLYEDHSFWNMWWDWKSLAICITAVLTLIAVAINLIK